MPLVKTSLHLDDKTIDECKKIACEQDVSFAKWLRREMQRAVAAHKKAKARKVGQ